MPITFTPSNNFYESHKMSKARISMGRALEILGSGTGKTSDNKSLNNWNGIMKLEDGTEVKVACWDWNGSSLSEHPEVSVWCDKPQYLRNWINLLEG